MRKMTGNHLTTDRVIVIIINVYMMYYSHTRKEIW